MQSRILWESRLVFENKFYGLLSEMSVFASVLGFEKKIDS
jgi:hypothetical protein